MALSLASCPALGAARPATAQRLHRRSTATLPVRAEARHTVPAHPSPCAGRHGAYGPARRLVAGRVAARQSQGAGSTLAATKRNIVLPVDNSEDADFAVSWALNHIYTAGDCLHLLYCIPPYKSKTTFNEGEALAHAERQAATKDAVQQRFQELLLARGVPAQDLVYDILEEEHLSAGVFGVADVDTEDDPDAHAIETPNMVGDAIISKAAELGAAAVVMASHNKGPIAEFFLGSVTSYCSQHCPEPVVVLHNVPHPKDDDHKEGSGRNLAVAIDNSSLSEKSLKWTLDNVYRAGDTVHVMHVVPPLGGAAAVADGFGDSSIDVDDGVSEKYRAMLDVAQVKYEIDLIQEHFLDSIIADDVRMGTALVSKAEDLDASMLVMASHSKGGMDEFLIGSVSSYVTRHANDIPVIVLHP
mmetsp:Transcript_7020/g.18002  ORF Transcript_7020/g.18002 Transcript_7020/m.18002 type:complete len:415 (-) Transcript_7020:187-1431(-)